MQDCLFLPETFKDTGKSFANSFDRVPFTFQHALDTAEEFSLPALCALASRRAERPNSFYMESGETRAGAKWKPSGMGLRVDQALKGFAENNNEAMLWILLKRVQEDAVYARLLSRWIEELSQMLGFRLLDLYRDPVMTVLITSPRRITPCHCDGEANLLMQIRGSKTVWIANGDDRSVLPESALERFWSGDLQPIELTPATMSKAWSYELKPGIGVTNPVAFPHWVENGSEVSVSLSLNFKRRFDHAANVHKVNSQLRKLGLDPKAPGRSKLRDETKSGLYRGALAIKRKVEAWRSPAA
jgi:hypothetical protein